MIKEEVIKRLNNFKVCLDNEVYCDDDKKLTLKELQEVIKVLERGEKFEAMWQTLLEDLDFRPNKEKLHMNWGDFNGLMIKIQQKYFPKPKETIDKSSLLDLVRQMNESYLNYIEAHLLRGMPIEPSHLHMFANSIIRGMERNMKND